MTFEAQTNKLTNEEIRARVGKLYPLQTAQEQREFGRAITANGVYLSIAEILEENGYLIKGIVQKREGGVLDMNTNPPEFHGDSNPYGTIFVDPSHIGVTEMQAISQLEKLARFNLKYEPLRSKKTIKGEHKSSRALIEITTAPVHIPLWAAEVRQ